MEKLIKLNKQAGFNYFLEKEIEAGVQLEGWEVKSLLEKKYKY